MDQSETIQRLEKEIADKDEIIQNLKKYLNSDRHEKALLEAKVTVLETALGLYLPPTD